MIKKTKTTGTFAVLAIAACLLLWGLRIPALAGAGQAGGNGTVTIINEGGGGNTGGNSGGGSRDRDRDPHRPLFPDKQPGPESVAILPEDQPLEETLGALPTTGGNTLGAGFILVGISALVAGAGLLARSRKRVKTSSRTAAE